MALDQSVFTVEIARGVIDRLTTTMSELLQSGQSVKWDGLGTFHPEVESAGAKTPEAYDINSDVHGIHIRFCPVNDKGEELTSRKFAESLVFNIYGNKTTKKVTTESGKSAYTGKIVVSSAVNAKSKLPLMSTVDGEKPDTVNDYINLKTTGSEVKLTGSVAGVEYTLKRGEKMSEATALGKATSTGTGNPLTITTDAAAADTTSKDLYVVWNQSGKEKYVTLGSSKIVAAEAAPGGGGE